MTQYILFFLASSTANLMPNLERIYAHTKLEMAVRPITGAQVYDSPNPWAKIQGHLNFLYVVRVIEKNSDAPNAKQMPTLWYKILYRYDCPISVNPCESPGSVRMGWVSGAELLDLASAKSLALNYVPNISSEQAFECCRLANQKPASTDQNGWKEECVAGGETALLDVGWTPTAADWLGWLGLQWLIGKGLGPNNFKPKPFSCSKT